MRTTVDRAIVGNYGLVWRVCLRDWLGKKLHTEVFDDFDDAIHRAAAIRENIADGTGLIIKPEVTR